MVRTSTDLLSYRKSSTISRPSYSSDTSRTSNPNDHIPSNQEIDSVAWKNLSVTVKDRVTGRPRDILSNVSGIARPGELMALMGDSRSDKTVLLNAIAQRQNGRVRGDVLVNGVKSSLSAHRGISAFVGREDKLVGSLTVEESLNFAARMQFPRTVSKSEASARISELLATFDLSAQRHDTIATGTQKGISEVQKRKLNLASHLLSAPRTLYLDDPTSGLDATSSLEIISLIRKIASESKLIVIISIHQPSKRCVTLFDKVTLLNEGRTCYYGSISGLPYYFRTLQIPPPALNDPAEMLLELSNVNSAAETKRLELLYEQWPDSIQAQKLQRKLMTLPVKKVDLGAVRRRKSLRVERVVPFLQRGFVKGYRDVFASA